MKHTPQKGTRSLTPKWLIGLGAAAIVTATLWAYLPAMRGGFIWDDDDYVSENHLLENFSGLGKIWWFRWKTNPNGQRHLTSNTPQYYPMVFSSFWLESRLWTNSNPTGFHVVNVLLHIANALLIWLICRRLGFAWGYIVALVFALHPVEVESVAWITERKNVLSSLFYLLALLSYLRFDRTSRQVFYWSSFGCFVLALLSKTVTCTLPVILLLLLWLRHGRIGWKNLLRVVPFFVVGAALGLFTAYYERYTVGTAGVDWQLVPWQRLVIAGKDVFFYISKLLWPMKLTFIYPRWNPPDFSPLDLLWPVGVVLVTAGLWHWRRAIGRAPLVAWGGFVISLFPALGFVDVYPFRFSFVADHFQYLASMFFIALVVGLAHGIYKRLCREGSALWVVRSAAIALAVVVVVLLGWLSRAQAGVYTDKRSLWEDTVAKNDQAWLGWHNLGTSYSRLGQAREAIKAYKRAVQVKPDYIRAYASLGDAYSEVGRHGDAIQAYKQAIAIKDDNAMIHNSLGTVYGQRGRYREALAELDRAISIVPDYGEAHYNLGTVHFKMRRYDEAIKAYKEAIRLNTSSAEAHFYVGVGYLRLGQRDSAVEQLSILEGLDRSLAERLRMQIYK